jgi:acetamidase/formamidase
MESSRVKTHEIVAKPDTVHWGYFDYHLEPVLSISSGDRLIVHTLSGHPDLLPEDPNRVPEELQAIHSTVRKGPGPHILVGPIAVEGAEPGNVLEVVLEDICPRFDWAYNRFSPMKGALPDDFSKGNDRIINLNLEAGTAEVAPGWDVPLRPFFGILGVSPPEGLGMIPSNPPYLHGGNLDNKELVAGSTLYLPVWKPGAGFSVGDGHGAQGDGEVDQTAVETSMVGTFRLTVRKDLNLKWPRAETSSHYIAMGFNQDLEEAAKMALREMIDFLANRFGLNREDAYVFCSTAVDIRITQLVNGYKGAHAMLAKELTPS